jgi:hypothetical protein
MYLSTWLSGSKAKKYQWSIKCLAMQFSSNKVSRSSDFNQSGFAGLGIQPNRLWGVGSSVNQVSRSWEFSQSGFDGWTFSQSGAEGLGVEPLRCFRSFPQIQSGFLGPGFEPITLWKNRFFTETPKNVLWDVQNLKNEFPDLRNL